MSRDALAPQLGVPDFCFPGGCANQHQAVTAALDALRALPNRRLTVTPSLSSSP